MKPLLLMLSLFHFFFSYGQKQKVRPQVATMRVSQVADTSPIRRAHIEKRLRVNPRLAEEMKIHKGTIDTVPTLEPYLKEKAACDFEKSVDNEGCILIKYADGFIKKVCEGVTQEVITKDGKKYVKRTYQTMKMEVQALPPPPNPSTADPVYKWINKVSEDLLSDVKLLMGNDNQLVTDYMSRENAKCNGSIYRRIEYRMIFIENFYEAQ